MNYCVVVSHIVLVHSFSGDDSYVSLDFEQYVQMC